VAGSCEHGNERSVSIIGGEIRGYTSDCHLLKKLCAPYN
jgi:hypothetical protein